MSGNKCSPVESHSVGMDGRGKKGRGNKAKRRKDLVLYQEKARALNLNLSCSYLKERACDTCFGRRVCLSEVESWGYLPSFSVVAILSILVLELSRPGYLSHLTCRDQQQLVLTEVMVPARRVTRLSGWLPVGLCAEGMVKQEERWIPKKQARGVQCCGQESRGGTSGEEGEGPRHFAHG